MANDNQTAEQKAAEKAAKAAAKAAEQAAAKEAAEQAAAEAELVKQLESDFPKLVREIKSIVVLKKNTEDKVIRRVILVPPTRDPLGFGFTSVGSSEYDEQWVKENPVLAIHADSRLARHTTAEGQTELIKKIKKTPIRQLRAIIAGI